MAVYQMQTMESMLKALDSVSEIQERMVIEEMKEQFLEMLNNQFGNGGLMFEYGETVNLSFRSNLPAVIIPNVNVVYRGNNEKIAYFDTRAKCLVNFCEQKIDNIQSEIFQTKKLLKSLENKSQELETDYKKLRWNVFLVLFNRKKVKMLQYELRDLKEKVEELKFQVEVHQSDLEFENDVKDRVLDLAQEMKNFGVKYRSA